jgi:hypothetical protein
MGSVVGIIFIILGVLVGVVIAAVLVMYLVVPLFKAIGWIFTRIFGFIAGEVADLARLIGALITSIIFLPLILGTVVIGRWSASAHFGRAFQREVATMGGCLYRIFLGHPARLVGLAPLTEGLEHRIPEVVRAAPGSDKPAGRAGQFDGYKIIGSLMGPAAPAPSSTSPSPTPSSAPLRAPGLRRRRAGRHQGLLLRDGSSSRRSCARAARSTPPSRLGSCSTTS